jgi:hypothetical protein
MMLRTVLVILVFSMVASAQTGTKQLTDERGNCRASVPADATVFAPWMAQGPNKSYSVMLETENDTVAVLKDSDLKTYHYSRALENTANRQIVEKEPGTVSAGYRAFHVYVPVKGGRCHAGISFKTSVPEEKMKSIATSVKAK